MRSLWLAVPAALVLAGIIHIAAVLGMPYLAPRSAWERLSALSKANEMLVLPAATPGQQTLPLMAPDVRYAVCRFDIGEGAVRLRTPVPQDYWIIALYTPDGRNFYTISGAELKREEIEIVISTESEAVFEIGASILDDLDDLLVVAAPQTRGIAMIRAPLPGPSHAARTEQALKQSSCSRKMSSLSSPSG